MALHLTVAHSRIGDGTRRTISLAGGPQHDRIEIFFESPEVLPPPSLVDGFVWAIIFYAMQIGRPLVVEGSMTEDALSNMAYFQEAWACWRPGTYRRIDIRPSRIEASPRVAPRVAISALSGGVDSIFTLLRHSDGSLGNAALPVRSALLVHGFDVQLNEPKDFEGLIRRVKRLSDRLDVGLKTIRTNLKELNIQEWNDSFLAQLSACMFNFSHDHSICIAGSGEPYNSLIVPWGQNPCTDYLLSGATFRTVHDGAGFSRTEKVAAILKNTDATAVVKVCWQGAIKSENCGHCEKCVRTRLNFLAAGIPTPPCFEGELSHRAIRSIQPKTEIQKQELVSILEFAKRHGTSGRWSDVLSERLNNYSPPGRLDARRDNLMVKARNVGHLLRRGEFARLGAKVTRKIIG